MHSLPCARTVVRWSRSMATTSTPRASARSVAMRTRATPVTGAVSRRPAVRPGTAPRWPASSPRPRTTTASPASHRRRRSSRSGRCPGAVVCSVTSLRRSPGPAAAPSTAFRSTRTRLMSSTCPSPCRRNARSHCRLRSPMRVRVAPCSSPPPATPAWMPPSSRRATATASSPSPQPTATVSAPPRPTTARASTSPHLATACSRRATPAPASQLQKGRPVSSQVPSRAVRVEVQARPTRRSPAPRSRPRMSPVRSPC